MVGDDEFRFYLFIYLHVEATVHPGTVPSTAETLCGGKDKHILSFLHQAEKLQRAKLALGAEFQLQYGQGIVYL